jgi:hypothetical protein
VEYLYSDLKAEPSEYEECVLINRLRCLATTVKVVVVVIVVVVVVVTHYCSFFAYVLP